MWNEHRDAVFAAIAEIGETQDRISALRDKAEADQTLIGYATGGLECNMESGRNAFEFSGTLLDAIDGLFRHTEEIIAELQRYANGF